MTGKKHWTDRNRVEHGFGNIKINKHARIRMVLVYPNTYHIGMSNLGFQTVYRQLNSFEDISCERAFLPDAQKKADGTLKSIETGRKLKDFHVIAFSVSFENDFLNILKIMGKAELPLRSNAREDSHPLMIAGGVACFMNPEPIAPFMDCFLLGESENILQDFTRHIETNRTKQETLKDLSAGVSGIYVPSFYTHEYNHDNTLKKVIPESRFPKVIESRKTLDIDHVSTTTEILTRDTTFKNTCLIEVSRGCAHGCRFCSAGYIYRPPRFRSPHVITQEIKKGAEQTNRIGLVGAAVSDFPGLTDVCRQTDNESIRISFSSLRANALNDDLLSTLRKSNVKTATIAPEAGSARLRTVINKGITEKDVLTAVKKITRAGIMNIKLYFMIGLPSETPEDIEELVELILNIKETFLKESRKKKKMGLISVSINPFIPKAGTPFQWSGMDDKKTINGKIKIIRSGLKGISNIRISIENLKDAYINALLSRGDRRIADLLEEVLANGGNWAKTLKESDIDTDFYITRERNKNELFPWDFIDHGVKKSFLFREYERAMKEKTSPPCPLPGNCTLCGACKK